jgi:hypothetical protein
MSQSNIVVSGGETEGAQTGDRVMRARSASRRGAFVAAGVSAAAILLTSTRAEAAANAAYQDLVKNGADPTGAADSSPAFTAAFNKLPQTGGTIYCASGTYLLNEAVAFSNKPLALVGDGSGATVFIMGHTGVAFTFTSTANYPSYYPFKCQGIGISGPGAGNSAAGALSINFPWNASFPETGFQSCLLDDISIGVSIVDGANGSNILVGLNLVNICKSQISNVRMFGPFLKAGSAFAVVTTAGGGQCIDNKFINCVSDGPLFGVAVEGVTQGLHFVEPLIIAGTGISSNFTGASILGLYISGGEVTGSVIAADLANINGGYIADTHFGCNNINALATVSLVGSLVVRMSNLAVSGDYNGGSAQGGYGIAVSAGQCQFNNIIFNNLGASKGILFVKNAIANLAIGLQLVDQTNYPHRECQNFCVRGG